MAVLATVRRIGTDGWSAWTFPYFGIAAPTPSFSNLGNLSVGDGVIATPQGACVLGAPSVRAQNYS